MTLTVCVALPASSKKMGRQLRSARRAHAFYLLTSGGSIENPRGRQNGRKEGSGATAPGKRALAAK